MSNFFFLIGFHQLNHIHIFIPGHIGKMQFVLGENKFLTNPVTAAVVVNNYETGSTKGLNLRAIPQTHASYPDSSQRYPRREHSHNNSRNY